MSLVPRVQEYIDNVKQMRQEWTSVKWDEYRAANGRQAAEEKFIMDHSKFNSKYPNMMNRILSLIDIPEHHRALLEAKEITMLDKQLEIAKTGQEYKQDEMKLASFDVFMPEIKSSIKLLGESKAHIEQMVINKTYLGTCLAIQVAADRTISGHEFVMAQDLKKIEKYKQYVSGTLEKPGVAVVDKSKSYEKWLAEIQHDDYKTYYPLALFYPGQDAPILARVVYPWLQNSNNI